MRKNIILILLGVYSFCSFASEDSSKSVTFTGTDFYYASLAYNDYSSRDGIIFKQDRERVDAYINHLKSLKGKYRIPMSRQELSELSREEINDYYALERFVSVSEEIFRDKSFGDINEYKFSITYGKENVEVYMYIDNPSVRGGDARYLFDYDGNIISRKYGR